MSNRKWTGQVWVLAAALVAAGVLAAPANASPIRFDNPAGPGHFVWGGVVGDFDRLLDIRSPASAQPAPATGPGVFSHTTTLPSVVGVGEAGDGLQLDATYSYYATGVDAGELIPSGLPWGAEGTVYFEGGYTNLPEGVETYLGMRFDLGGGYQHGWVGVVRTGPELDAFAWGYETEVGVPVPAGAPEPGTLALLAMGAVGVLRRRRGA